MGDQIGAGEAPKIDPCAATVAPSFGGNGRRGRWGHIFAAIDLGTNNCRLLIARPTQTGFRIIDAYSRIVRLGEGLAHSGALSPAAQDRSIEALIICARKMQRRGVTRGRFVATQACRMAHNGLEFLDRVYRETGLYLELIPPESEARLAVSGCLPLLDPHIPHALVFDIGGGSTEIIRLHRRSGAFHITAWTSLPVGVVTLSERYGGRAMVEADYAPMVAEVRKLVRPFAEAACRDLARTKSGRLDPRLVQVLGTSGTVTTLAGVHMGLARYDRSRVDGTYMTTDAILVESHRLAGMSFERRAANPCIGPDRADLVVAGCAILEGINQTWPVDRLRVADRGLREGILAGLMDEADEDARRYRRRPVDEAIMDGPIMDGPTMDGAVDEVML